MRPTRLLLHLGLLAAGFVAGCLGSFAHAHRVASLPVGLAIAYGLTSGVLVAAGLAGRTRSGAGVAAAGWVVALLLMSAPRPEGDLVVPGDALGYAWSVGGLLLCTVALAVPWHRLASGAAAVGR